MSDSDNFLISKSSIWWFFFVIVLMRSVLGSFLWGSKSGLLDWILHLVQTQMDTTMLLMIYFLNWQSVNMHSIVLGVSVPDPRDCGLWYWSLY